MSAVDLRPEPGRRGVRRVARAVLASIALALTAALPTAGQSEVHAALASIEAHRQFATAEAVLEKPPESARRVVHRHCAAIDHNCLNFVREHTDLVLSTVPDDAGFWLAYRSALAAEPMPIEQLQDDDLSVYGAFMAAATGWLRRDLATTGLTDLGGLHDQVLAHRRRLARANLILDKMAFASTTGVLLDGVHAHMALREGPGTDNEERRLDEMLAPLARDERSMRRVREGERAYVARALADDGDLEAAVAGIPWRAHAVALHRLDAALAVLRALRAAYDGRRQPGMPPTPPPDGWQWRWVEGSGSLCLDRVSVDADEGFGAGVCVAYLAPPGSQATDRDGAAAAVLSRVPAAAPADCDGQVPGSIEGSWREDADWTRQEHIEVVPETLTSSPAWGGGAPLTITPDRLIFELPGIGTIERSYTLVGGSDRRYLLELTDHAGASETMTLTLVPCGLAIDNTQSDCSSEYCRNARNEALKLVADKSGLSLEALKDQVQSGRRERQPPPRIYYRPTKS